MNIDDYTHNDLYEDIESEFWVKIRNEYKLIFWDNIYDMVFIPVDGQVGMEIRFSLEIEIERQELNGYLY
jgi:hypothetical protein